MESSLGFFAPTTDPRKLQGLVDLSPTPIRDIDLAPPEIQDRILFMSIRQESQRRARDLLRYDIVRTANSF